MSLLTMFSAATGPSRLTVSDLLDMYRADFVLRECRSVRSLDSEIRQVNRHLGDLPAEEVTTRVLRDYQTTRKAEGEKGVANATVNKELANLSAAFKLADSNERIPAVPKFPAKLPPGKPRQGFFEVEHYKAIHAELPRWASDVLEFGYYSGWRLSEITGLTWSEVDLPGPLVRLDPDRSKNKETRVIPLMAWGLEAIERRQAVRVDGLPLVFHRDGRPILSHVWWTTWKDATKRAGHPGLLFHDLRRSVCRNLELAGVPRTVAMGWVGHRTESVYRRYCIMQERDVAAAGVKLVASIRQQAVARNIEPDWMNLEPPPSSEPNPADSAPEPAETTQKLKRAAPCSHRFPRH